MNDRHKVRATLTFASACLLMLPASRVGAVDCTISCTPPANTSCTCVDTPPTPCTITTAYTFAPGAVIDCTGQDVVLQNDLSVTDGFLTLQALDLTILASRHIRAFRATSNVPFGVNLEMSNTLTINGTVEAKSDLGGGSVTIDAATDIVLSGQSDGILVNGTAGGASGGQMALTSGRDVRIEKDLIADGGATQSRGGEIGVEAGRDVIIGARLRASGWDEGGGSIHLAATDGLVDENSTATAMYVRAGGFGQTADGGEVSIAGKQIIIGGNVLTQGGSPSGGDAQGGEIRLEAGTLGVAINASLDTTSGGAGTAGDAGGIFVDSDGPITVASGVTLNARSDANGGDGGDIRMTSEGKLTINAATLDARGDWSTGTQGSGATVELSACNVVVNSGATIDVRGYNGGTVVLSGREALTVSSTSTVNATNVGGAAGEIVLDYRLPGRCSSDPAVGCEADQCAATGVCSNNATVQCTTNANCTFGCNTGTCVKHCIAIPSMSCTTNANCTGCVTGTCQTNPDTGGVTTQFVPGPPKLEEHRALRTCS